MVVSQEDKINSERVGHLPEELAHFDINEVNRSISDRFESQVAITPNNTAVKSRSQSITYNQLNIRANMLAHAILASQTENVEAPAVAS